MNQKKTPDIKDEESPERIADYHRGSDNSIKKVVRDIQTELKKEGKELKGLDDEDIDRIREPDNGKKEIKEPPRPQKQR